MDILGICEIIGVAAFAASGAGEQRMMYSDFGAHILTSS
jgi:hypothetical protein